ncbi:hypothetical protein BN1723_011864 [Verticillium longisporum]|uniref:Ribosome biogenesis protein NOP53 n=2 Tax=Verticillium longisporum TaxID=100787 RepID=A0A0G4LBZ8_VERLO|nr:hypothetical protein BN1723_011864 [Verticillium longisporum]
MPVLKPLSGSTEAPQQHKQPSRKGKKAWRKNVDLTEVEQGLDALNDEIIRGGVAAEKDSADLFAIDTVGETDPKKKQRVTKTLRADEIIAQRSAVPAVSLRKRPAPKTSDGLLPTKRARKDWVSAAELARLRRVADGQAPSTIDVQPATYDVWAAPPPVEKPVVERAEDNFIPAKEMPKPPRTLRHKPVSLAASGKTVRAVAKPKGGHSYNPLFEDYAARLEVESAKAVEAEKKRLAKAPSTIDVQPATYDVWAAPPPVEKPVVERAEDNFIPEKEMPKPPRTLRHKPVSLAASGKTVRAVAKPKGGHSYNPLFEDYAARLEVESAKAVEAEKKRLAKVEETRLREEAIARSAAEADAAEARANLSEWDEDSAWEGFETDAEGSDAEGVSAPSKPRKRKTTDYAARLEVESAKAVEVEKKRLAKEEETRLREEAIARSAAEADAAEARANLSEWDEDSAWEGFETDAEGSDAEGVSAASKPRKRKTTVQRNRIKRRKAEEGLKKHESKIKARDEQTKRIREIASDIAERDAFVQALVAQQAEVDSSDEEDDGAGEVVLRRKKLGKSKLPEGDLELVLPDELQDSLRRLRPEGNLLKDRYRSLLVRGKVESRRRIAFHKAPKVKYSEKWSYKDFRL